MESLIEGLRLNLGAKAKKAAYDKIYRAKMREKIAAYKADWYRENAGRVLAEQKEKYAKESREQRTARNERYRNWTKNNPEKAREISGRSYRKNIEKKRAYQKYYGATFPWKRAAACMKRLSIKRNATPKWADFDAIEAIYKKAHDLTMQTGVVHQVDHIWPLQGRGFTGLHVPWNLQVLPRLENIRKGNKRPDAIA